MEKLIFKLRKTNYVSVFEKTLKIFFFNLLYSYHFFFQNPFQTPSSMSSTSFFDYVLLNLQEYSSTEMFLIAFVTILVIIILIFIFSDQRNTHTFASLPYENFTSTTPDQPYGTPLASLQELKTLSLHNPTVLLVYDSNCGYCQQIRPVWKTIFEDSDLTLIAHFRSVGGGDVRNIIEKEANVSGYPSIFVVTSDMTYHAYNGSRDFNSLKQFITTFKVV